MTKHNGHSRDKVVEIMNSVLVANKRSMTWGMPIAQLEGEYKEQVGTRIPFRELGYPTLQEFLQSLQRSDEIALGKRDGMTVVYPRINERIAHVSALVARQKDSGGSRRFARGGKRSLAARSCYPRTTYLPVTPARLDSQTLADVVKLVRKTPEGMRVEKLLEYLRDRNHSGMSREHLIRQLRDVGHEINVDRDTIYPIGNKQQQNYQQNYQQNHQHQHQQQQQFNWAGASNPGKNGHAAEATISTGIRPAGISDSEEDEDERIHQFVSLGTEERTGSGELRVAGDESREAEVKANVDGRGEEIEERGKREEIEVREETEEKEERETEAAGILVNARTRFRLEKLIQQHPNGIWCAELPSLYQREYCIPLSWEDLGFASVSDFAAHLPEIFYSVRLRDKGDFKLFDARAPRPETRETARPQHVSLAELHNIYQNYGQEDEAVPVLLSSSTSLRLFPDGVMTAGETVGQICVTALFPDENTLINVVVVDIVTPTFFWIQLLHKMSKFRQFMADLHAFYTANASKYVIPIILLERGLNCACIFDHKWHRGIIKAVKPDNTVTVEFYDYGTVKSYPPEDIHFLHRSFASLAAQAIPCGLWNVRPKTGDKWLVGVCQAFVCKVLDVPMVAMLGTIDPENNSMLIALADTNGSEDVHINDWMVSSGYAKFGKSGETVDLNESYEVPWDPIANGGTTSGCDVESEATHSTQFASPDGLPGQSMFLQPIPKDSVDPALEEVARTMPDIMSRVDRQEKKILALEAVIKAAIAKGFTIDPTMDLTMKPTMDPTLDASANGASLSQSAIQRPLGRSADLEGLEDLFGNTRIGFSNNNHQQQQPQSSRPPPIPPRPPRYANIAVTAAGNGVDYQPEILQANGNGFVCDPKILNGNVAVYQPEILNGNGIDYRPEMLHANGNGYVYQPEMRNSRHDVNVNAFIRTPEVNVNVAKNPFAVPAASASTPQFRDFTHDSNFADGGIYDSSYVESNEPRVDSATNDFTIHSAAPVFQAQENFNSPKNVEKSEEKFAFRDPTDLVKPRESFELSLEQSARTFFERLEAKSSGKNRGTNTNPFVSEIENAKFHGKNSSPLKSADSKNCSSTSNPFSIGDEIARSANVAQSRLVYQADPVIYDYAGKNRARSDEVAYSSRGNEREILEASKQIELATWIEHGRRPVENLVDKTETQEIIDAFVANGSHPGDFPSRTIVQCEFPPPIPPRFQASITETTNAAVKTSNEAVITPNAAVKMPNASANLDPNVGSVSAEWLKATENVKKWTSKDFSVTGGKHEEDARWGGAVGGPIAANNERAIEEKNVTIKRECATGRGGEGEEGGGGKPEVFSSVQNWYFHEVALTRQSVYLIQHDNEAWLTVEEFLAAFTNTKFPEVMLKILDIQNAQIPFRFIHRSDCPVLFQKLDRTSLAVPRNHNGRIGDSLHLVPIRSILKILRKLNITNIKQIELARKKQIFPPTSAALYDALNVINRYANIQINPPSS